MVVVVVRELLKSLQALDMGIVSFGVWKRIRKRKEGREGEWSGRVGGGREEGESS